MKENFIMQNTKIKYYLAGFNFLICSTVMILFVLNKHFSVDDYWAFYHQHDSALASVGMSARPIGGGILYILNKLGINVVQHQIIFGILFVLAVAWATTKITLEVIELINPENGIYNIVLLNGGTLILFINASISEYLYYTVMYTSFTVAILSMTYAIVYIKKETNILKNWLIGVLALTITASTYQIFIAQYTCIIMFIMFVHSSGKINKKTVFSIFRSGLAAFIAIAINLFISKLLVSWGGGNENSRLNINLSEFSRFIHDFLLSQQEIWIDGMGLYPRYILFITLLLLLFFLVYTMKKNHVHFEEYFFVSMVLFSGICVVYMAQIMQGYIRVINRMMMPVFAVYSLLIWLLYYYLNGNKKNTWKKIGLILLGFFWGYSSIKVNEVAIDTIKTNTISRCYIEEINRRIKSYELEHGIIITKVGFCSDAHISYRYYQFINTTAYGDMCANPFLANWSDYTSLNYYSKQNFIRVEVPNEIAEYYALQNWDEANWDEQLYFDNDAVYICVY